MVFWGLLHMTMALGAAENVTLRKRLPKSLEKAVTVCVDVEMLLHVLTTAGVNSSSAHPQ